MSESPDAKSLLAAAAPASVAAPVPPVFPFNLNSPGGRAGMAAMAPGVTRAPLLILLGSQWRWDDGSLQDPELTTLLETCTRANNVVRARQNTTSYAQGLATLAAGNRKGEHPAGWSLGSAIVGTGTKLHLFGEAAAFGVGLADEVGTASTTPGVEFSESSTFRGANPTVFVDLLKMLMSPGSVVVVDTNAFPTGMQTGLLREVFQSGDTWGWNTIAVSISDVAYSENQELMVDLVDANVPLENSSSAAKPRLQVFAARGPQFGDGGAISASTHRTGWVQTADVTATILHYVGAKVPETVQGSSISTSKPVSPDVLSSMARRAAMIRSIQPWFIPGLIVGDCLLLILGVWSLNRRTHRKLEETWQQPTGLLGFWRMFATFMALIPSLAFLMNLAPWWELGPADTDLAAADFWWFGALLPVALSALVALLWSVLGLNSLLGPFLLISVSSLIIGVLDPLIGSPMVLDSVIGLQSTMGGRFFGIDNTMFAVFSTGALMFAAVVFAPVVERKRSRASSNYLLLILIIFAVAMIFVDASPGLGADFGGTLALIPGFAVLILKFRGKPLKGLSSALIALFTIVVAGGIAYLDWLSPADERTHLGNFVEAIARGELGSVIHQKLTFFWDSGWSPWIIIACGAAIIAVMLVLAIPLLVSVRNPYRRDYGWLWGWEGAKIQPEGIKWSLAERALFTAWTVTMILGLLLNDTGPFLLLTGIAVMFPAVLAQSCHKFLVETPTGPQPS